MRDLYALETNLFKSLRQNFLLSLTLLRIAYYAKILTSGMQPTVATIALFKWNLLESRVSAAHAGTNRTIRPVSPQSVVREATAESIFRSSGSVLLPVVGGAILQLWLLGAR